MKKFLWSLWEVFEVVFVAFITVFLIRTFLVQPFLVNGASMEPSFSNGNYLLIDELTYRLREPERGEVVVFRPPTNEATYFIKRIIGLPGERVEVRDGAVTIFSERDGKLTPQETYLAPGTKTFGNLSVTLKDNQYFVMGDNRSYSFDSRSWGPLDREDMVGLVRLRLWPFNEVMAFEAPAY